MNTIFYRGTQQGKTTNSFLINKLFFYKTVFKLQLDGETIPNISQLQLAHMLQHPIWLAPTDQDAPAPYFSTTTKGRTYSLVGFNLPSHNPSSLICLYNIFTISFWKLIIHFNTYSVASSMDLIHVASYTILVRFRPFDYDLFSPAPPFPPLFLGHVIYNFSLNMLCFICS